MGLGGVESEQKAGQVLETPAPVATGDVLPIAQRSFDKTGRFIIFTTVIKRENVLGEVVGISAIQYKAQGSLDDLINKAEAESPEHLDTIIGAGINAYYQRIPLDEFQHDYLYSSRRINPDYVIKLGQEQIAQRETGQSQEMQS